MNFLQRKFPVRYLYIMKRRLGGGGVGGEAKTRSDVTAEEHLFGKQVQFNYILLLCCHTADA